MSLDEIDFSIISTIKSEHPKCIRELSVKLNKNISTIHPHVKKLEKQGLIEFENGMGTNNIPVCDFDPIKLEF